MRYSKNAESAKMEYPEVPPSGSGKSRIGENRKRSRGQPQNGVTPFGGARGRPEDALGKPADSAKIPTPPALSVQLKEKRDAAILEKHKEGMSNRAIAKLFKMGSSTVDEVVSKEAPENPNLGKSGTPESSTSTVPMASTEDRSETREDARS